MGPGLADLHMEGWLSGKLFTTEELAKAGKGRLARISKAPKMSEQHKLEKILKNMINIKPP